VINFIIIEDCFRRFYKYLLNLIKFSFGYQMKNRQLFTIIWFILVLIISSCSPSTPATVIKTQTRAPKPTTTVTVGITPSPTIAPQLSVTPGELNGVQIEFWHGWAPEITRVVEQQVNEFNQTNSWGIFVKIKGLGGSMELNDAIAQSMTDGNEPDVVVTSMDELLNYQSHGIEWEDLNIYVNSSEWGLSNDQISDFYSPIWEADEIEGVRIGFPAYRTAQVIFYNQSWAQDLSFDTPPTTSTEFSNQACTAALANSQDSSSSNDGTGGWIINTDPYTVLNWLVAFGFDIKVQSNSQTLVFTTPASESAFQFLRGLSNDGCAWNARQPTPDEYLLKRNALFYSGWIEDILKQETTSTLIKATDTWTVLPFPGPKGGQTLLLSGESYAIRKTTSVKKLAAWLFIRWMVQPANLAQIVKATGSLPILKSEIPMLKDFGQKYPDWTKAVEWLRTSEYAPVNNPWLVEKMVLQDAFWQALQANKKIEDIPNILKQLDATVLDIITNTQ
jgi:ABC-type glycerol-3-phosphate transport system substrate-binding protein